MAYFICEKQGRCCPHEFYDSIEQAITDCEDGVPCDHLIEVAPVRHGRWIAIKVPNEWDKGQCSECRSIFNSSVWGTNYCPDCGAKMEKGGPEP